MALTPKEKLLLKDMKKQSQLCASKYETYTTCVKDPQLIDLLTKIHACETKCHTHIVSVDKDENPTPLKCGTKKMTFKEHYSTTQSNDKKHDCFACNDMLSMEKYLAALYNTCVFEFTTDEHRAVLNHIQTECQRHGKLLYDYMLANNMVS